MTVCKYCHTDSATLIAQAERIEMLEGELNAEKRRSRLDIITAPQGFTRSEHQILALLLVRDMVRKQEIWDAIEHTKEDADPKGLDVIMCRFRKKLRDSLGLELETVRALGYRIPREQREGAKQQLAVA